MERNLLVPLLETLGALLEEALGALSEELLRVALNLKSPLPSPLSTISSLSTLLSTKILSKGPAVSATPYIPSKPTEQMSAGFEAIPRTCMTFVQ
jgi:hypothetical protein